MKKSQTFKRSLPILFAATLAACGGGGGDAPAPTPAPAPAPATLADVVTSVPTPTYAAGSEALAAFNTLNAERSRCGFGMVAQDSKLDAAALDHAKWRLLNNSSSHVQSGGNGFTAETAALRATFRGYAHNGGVFDEIASAPGVGPSGQGAKLIKGLLSAPYHAIALLGVSRDVGISFLTDVDVGTTASTGTVNTLQVNLSTKAGQSTQINPPDTVLSYPCDGTTGVPPGLYNETPNPIPGRDLATNPAGVAIMLRTRPGSTLSLSSTTVVKVSDGSSAPMRTPTEFGGDPSGLTPLNAPFILGDAPLAPLTAYRATVTGTLNGKAFSKVFTFTTAAQ